MKSLEELFIFHPSKGNTISGEWNLCGKLYSDHISSTGNFHKHLKCKHSSQYERSKDKSQFPSIQNNEDSPMDMTEKLLKINQAIVEDLIVKCNLPPAIVENVGFCRFLKSFAPKWKPTSSKYITKTLYYHL